MKRRPLATACLLVCLLLGLPVLFFKEPDEACQMEEREIRLTGKIMQKETKKQDYGETMTVCLSDLSNDGLGGRLLCYLAEGQREPKLGSYVEIEGRLKRFERASNPGQFDAALYYQISGISYRLDQAKITKTTTEYNRMGEMLWQIRKHLSGILSLRLPEKEAALMQTILLGEKESLDSEIKELYQRSGIAHILAISGVYTLSLVYITLCETPISCHFWAFYIPIITLYLILIFAHNCTLSYGVIEKSIFGRKYKHLRKSLLFGER